MTVVGAADFTTVKAGPVGTVTVAVDAGDVTVPPDGSVADTVAEFATDPLSISAWVTVYVAGHVVEAPGARVVVGQVIVPSVSPADAPVNVSATDRPVTVTFPVFVAKKLYVTV